MEKYWHWFQVGNKRDLGCRHWSAFESGKNSIRCS